MKKIIGLILIMPFIIMVVFAFVYNIITAGWYFAGSLLFVFLLVVVAFIGINLLFKKDTK